MIDIIFSNSSTKIKALADGIGLAIMQGELSIGDNLPSINEASAHYKVSRDTVFKAYNELRRRRLVDSTPTKGYFVVGEVNHILLLLDNYSSFKQDLYHRFMSRLPANYKVDLVFHQYNERLFETLVRENIGYYSMYVIMNFSNDYFSETLKLIPPGKLLLLDFGNFEKSQYAYICQDFNESFYKCLCEGKELFKKYKKIIFVFPEEICHPVSAIDYFRRFCEEYQFDYEVQRRALDWQGVEKGNAYLSILFDDMVKIVKGADASGFTLGQEIGLITYNNEQVLDVIKNGISAISVDFGLMGEKAAHFVTSRQTVQEYIPTQLVIRKSL